MARLSVARVDPEAAWPERRRVACKARGHLSRVNDRHAHARRLGASRGSGPLARARPRLRGDARTRSDFVSPRYTTAWQDLLSV
ncbi:DUF4113 domain-containing protein [Lichenifustis flavocetrariae]|uniref:DUF4113 domain-containing protein n=1 Tax=Lichenifustis flavocetrariae TaxID=2949735 RepID=UPI003D0C25AC